MSIMKYLHIVKFQIVNVKGMRQGGVLGTGAGVPWLFALILLDREFGVVEVYRHREPYRGRAQRDRADEAEGKLEWEWEFRDG